MSKVQEEAAVASMRLAYQQLSTADQKKAKELERLGMAITSSKTKKYEVSIRNILFSEIVFFL